MSGALGMFQSVLHSLVGPYFFDDWVVSEGLAQLGNTIFEATIFFAWSAIYFGYHFYDDLQKQKEKLLTVTAMAHQAQLKMLRYQLNPHFLFNTLNAISTLVLEKSTKEANQMLTKLSAFLRYTLVNQPTHRVSLDQELYALRLYLDIEKVRFQERLSIEYEIEEAARSGLIPSLILQPLIENSIKYAVAPSENGGQVRIAAKMQHMRRRMVVVLEDDGPGLSDPVNPAINSNSSGVGLANTRERLQQIYGDEHELVIENRVPNGLRITMIIPYEREESQVEI